MSDQDKDSTPEKEKMLQEKILREQPEHAPEHAVVSCEVCLKEVPQSLAHTEEAEDYVSYFCGLDCYDKWEHQKPAEKNKKP